MSTALILVYDVFSYLFHLKRPFKWFAKFGYRSTDYGKPSFNDTHYGLKIVLNGPINGARCRPVYMYEVSGIFCAGIQTFAWKTEESGVNFHQIKLMIFIRWTSDKRNQLHNPAFCSISQSVGMSFSSLFVSLKGDRYFE